MQTDLLTMLEGADDFAAPSGVPGTDATPVQSVAPERLFVAVQTIPGQLALGTDR